MSQIFNEVIAKKQKKSFNSLFRSIKDWLFLRNLQMVSTSKTSFAYASILIFLSELQKYCFISRLHYNPSLSSSSQMPTISSLSGYFVLDQENFSIESNTAILSVLTALQLLALISCLTPFKSTAINGFISTFIITTFSMVLLIPSVVQGTETIIQSKNIWLGAVLIVLTLANYGVYHATHFQISIERQSKNCLIRKAKPVTRQMLRFFMLILFNFTDDYLVPLSYPIYLGVDLLLSLIEIKELSLQFIYHNENITRIKGVLKIFNISTICCYLFIILTGNAIVSLYITIFIVTFFFFSSSFFLVYRNYVVKSTIINGELDNEEKTTIYVMWYLTRFKRITEKKNELYISSLLKNHSNKCEDQSCCCKNRNLLYDPLKKTYGNSNLQPHQDLVFTKHYFLKLLREGAEKYSKSIHLLFLMSYFYLEILEFVPQTIDLIKKLTKTFHKGSLILSEEYALFCLKENCYSRILEINDKKGNLNLENVQVFDQKIIELKESIKISIRMYCGLWKNMFQRNLEQKSLAEICKNILEMMFSIENCYIEIKKINNESSELRALMMLYSKIVVHDIHMFSEVKKEIKSNITRNIVHIGTNLKDIHLFGEKTLSLVSDDQNKLKWWSKNAPKLFEFHENEFSDLSIKNLMPKYFAENHDDYVERWKKTGLSYKLNSSSCMWATTKEGHVFSMLIFIKIIALPHEQNFAFFSVIEKINDENEVICSESGEIYGVGKYFSKSVGIPAKFFQEYRINIQILLPNAFEFFLEFFFSKLNKNEEIKQIAETRKEGYFPENIELIISNICQEKTVFEKKNKSNLNWKLEYCKFIQDKMQELTCHINGKYLSFLIEGKALPVFRIQRKCVFSFKVSGLKRDNLEKYYDEIEHIIKKLISLSKEEESDTSISVMKNKTFARSASKGQFFKKFLNPKKIKKELGMEENALQSHSEHILGEATQKRRKNEAKVLSHRRKLALSARYQIKNERVRHNLWRMKCALLKEGVLSRYTFNILIGKSNINSKQRFSSLTYLEVKKPVQEQNPYSYLNEEEHISCEELSSNNELDSEDELVDQENDNKTFHSAASSATFISMTNNVKQFKVKLRSLNTPKQLFILHVFILILVMAQISGAVAELLIESNYLKIGLMEFKFNKEASQIVDSLILAKWNTLNINAEPTNLLYLEEKKFYLNIIYNIYQNHLQNRPKYLLINSNILSYLNLWAEDTGNPLLQVRQFISQEQDAILADYFSHAQGYYTTWLAQNQVNTNLFFHFITNYQLIFFISQISFIIVAIFFTFPVICKIQSKFKEIHQLLVKISPVEKQKYYHHFKQLSYDINNEETWHTINLQNLIGGYDTKIKKMHSKSKADQDEVEGMERKKNQKQIEKAEDEKRSINKPIYIKILLLFLLIISALSIKYGYLTIKHNNLLDIVTKFNRVFLEKSTLSMRIVEINYQLRGHAHQYDSFSENLNLVPAIYNSYHVEGVTPAFQAFIDQFIRGDVCTTLLNSTLTDFELQQCKQVNFGTFTSGGLDNLYYTQRKFEQALRSYKKNETNPQKFFASDLYANLTAGFYFNTLMIYQMFDKISNQMQNFQADEVNALNITSAILITLVVVFLFFWTYLYFKLAEEASYVNAFLLLIPFDVLSENPYIKLYLKNEFDFKSNSY